MTTGPTALIPWNCKNEPPLPDLSRKPAHGASSEPPTVTEFLCDQGMHGCRNDTFGDRETVSP
jgi:hypothetical protein